MKLQAKIRSACRRSRLPAKLCIATGAILTALTTGEAWAVGGKSAPKLLNVADTRGMDPGPSKWIAELYNDNLWLYGLLVVVVMAAMGYILGLGFDRLLSMMGINLGRLEHHE